MAGGPTTPALVAAVSNTGGLGTLGAGYMSPDALRSAIGEIRNFTKRPFAVNLFIPSEPRVPDAVVVDMNQFLDRFRVELGLPLTPAPNMTQRFHEQLQVILDERVPVFSFTFGIPDSEVVAELKARDIAVIGTATTVHEALMLEEIGVDAVVAQGSEAGGHRGTFAHPFEQAMIGTMALVPQVADHVRIPVVASGGIMDGRGIAASLMLGASGVQMGTAFLTAEESGAHPRHKEAVLKSSEDETVVTAAFSGKPARGIRNRFVEEMSQYNGEIPEYPVQNALTQDIRQAAAKLNRDDMMSMWAGQGVRLAKSKSARELMLDWIHQVDTLLCGPAGGSQSARR
jgi:nitronate monooxygenase